MSTFRHYAMLFGAVAAARAPDLQAASPDHPVGALGFVNQPIETPGYGRVVFVFLGISTLAALLAWGLRRFGPGAVTARKPGRVRFENLGRFGLEPGVALHVVDVGDDRLAIVTSRSGIAVRSLTKAPIARSINGDAP